MRYRVIGSDEVSGEAMELVVEAKSADEARFKAGARGMHAERVEEADAPPVTAREQAPRRTPSHERTGLGDDDDGESVLEGPERDLWTGGPSQWINFKKFVLGLFAAVLLTLGAIYIPRLFGVTDTVWIALLIAIALPGIYAFWVWLMTRAHRYRVTDQRIEVKTGILTRRSEQVELYRIIDAEPTQTIVQRVLRRGTLTLDTTDASMPKLVLAWVPNHLGLWDDLRPIIAERRRHHRILEGVGEI